jgi:hypothetical protein
LICKEEDIRQEAKNMGMEMLEMSADVTVGSGRGMHKIVAI